jgi:hypothetical protein
MKGRSAAAARVPEQAPASRGLESEIDGTKPFASPPGACSRRRAVAAADVERWVVLTDAVVLSAFGGFDARELLDLDLCLQVPPSGAAPVGRDPPARVTSDADIQDAPAVVSRRVDVSRCHPDPRSRTLVRFYWSLDRAL